MHLRGKRTEHAMTRMIKAVNDGRLALCGWPGARFVWSLTASLGDLYCNPRLRRVKEKNLPPAEEEEVRPAWSPQVAPLMLLPSNHAVPLMELSARKGQTGCIIITLRWQFLVGNLGLGVTYQVHLSLAKIPCGRQKGWFLIDEQFWRGFSIGENGVR